MHTHRVALTLIVIEQAFVDHPVIAVSTGGICANTQGSFDCDSDGTGYCGPTWGIAVCIGGVRDNTMGSFDCE